MKTVSLVSVKVVAKAKVDATLAEITSEYCNLGGTGLCCGRSLLACDDFHLFLEVAGLES
jgi:hypothetical protein